MTENVVLRKSDKEVLSGEKSEADFDDFSTRKSQIRTRVRNRSGALADELALLQEAGEDELVEELTHSLAEQTNVIIAPNLSERIDRLERELDDIERRCNGIPELREELAELREMLEPKP